MISYYLEFTDLIDGCSCDDLKKFWVNIEEKSGLLEFLLFDNCFNIFHFAAQFARKISIFEFIWLKIKFYINESENLKDLLQIKDTQGFNALIISINNTNTEIFYFLFENIYSKYFDVEEITKQIKKLGKTQRFHELFGLLEK